MSPRNIAKKLLESKIDLAAITDHNSAKNAEVFGKVLIEVGIQPLFGVEITMPEEYHLLAITTELPLITSLGELLYSRLPDVYNHPEKLGDQVYVNEYDEIEGVVDKYLGLTVDVTYEELLKFGGGELLLIPAHVDKEIFSVISQLGFFPENYDAIEIYRKAMVPESISEPQRRMKKLPVLTNSDAHFLEDIGCAWNEFDTLQSEQKVTISQLRATLQQNQFQRKVLEKPYFN